MARKLPCFFFVLCVFVLAILVYNNNHQIMQIKQHGVRLTESTIFSANNMKSPQRSPDVSNSKAYLIPPDDKLRGLSEPQLKQIFWKYINTLQVLCRNQSRLGSFKDGGKEVCLDDAYTPRQPCIVYSFGSNNQFDFENAVTSQFKCQIHSFDPSMIGRGRKARVPPMVTFHDIGLWGKDTKNEKGWQMKTLSTVMKDLKHEESTIDILKIDVEGGEWFAFPQIFQNGTLQKVKQILIEIHYGAKWTKSQVRTMAQLSILRQLYEHGFFIFMHERNLHEFEGPVTPVNEISLINMNYYD